MSTFLIHRSLLLSLSLLHSKVLIYLYINTLHFSISELQHSATVKQKYDEVLQQAMEYLLAFETYGGCVVVISGWEALNRLRAVRYRRALKVVRNMKLLGQQQQHMMGGDIRKANFELLHLAEACAASQLGLYKAHAWNKRLERREGSLKRSASLI